MAGDWIKMRGNLWDDPRVGKLCDLTGCGEAQVIGGLYWLWATADQHTEDGVMPGLSLRQIDRKTGVPGLGSAMCEIGWLSDHPEGVVIVRFEEHNGTSAKRRCTDAKRKADVRTPSAHDADKTRTDDGDDEEEKRRLSELEKEKRRREEAKASSAPKAVAFDAATGQFQIPDLLMQQWRGAYPALSLDVELSRASAWLIANPKNAKSNYGRFLTNWLTKAQDKAPRVNGQTSPQQTAFEGAI